MRPTKQTKDNNCFQACIASLFEFPIEYLPDCMIESHWNWDEIKEWMNRRNWMLIEVIPSRDLNYMIPEKAYSIMSGPSPRGNCSHAVIGQMLDGNWKVVFDPHESNAGILSVSAITLFCWTGHEKCRGL